MLNELYALERGLAAASAAVVQQHTDIKDPGTGDAVRVRLREDGSLASIELIRRMDRGPLWTLRNGKHNSFPVLMLRRLAAQTAESGDSVWKQAKSTEKRSQLSLLVEQQRINLEDWPGPKYRESLKKRLEQLATLADDPSTAAVPEVFARFLKALDNSTSFLAAFFDELVIRAQDDAWLDVTRLIVLGQGKASIIVDPAIGDFGRDASDSRQVEPISRALQQANVGSNAVNSGFNICALTGSLVPLLSGPFPERNLPALGPTILFSRNKDIPALERYGRIGTACLPIGADLAKKLSGVINELTAPVREGKTWKRIPRDAGDKQDLLIVSLESNLLSVSADDLATEDDVLGWPAVEMAAQGVTRHFDGLADSISPQDRVRITILRKIDRGNCKAIFDRRTNAQALHKASLRWLEAMQNIPNSIQFDVGMEGNTLLLRRPPILPPISLVSVTHKMFANGGQRRIPVAGLPASEALAIFLYEGAVDSRAERALGLIVNRNQSLLSGLTLAEACGGDAVKKFDGKFDLRRDALRAVAWIGSLLFILDQRRERYMTNAAFKLGQLLAAADAIHIGYCADLRGGAVPPTLLGNSVFAIAGRDPIRALDILQGRWKPYGAWAEQEDRISKKAGELEGGKDEARASQMRRGCLQARLAAPLCSDLQAGLLDEPPDEQFRAKLLLGYVAGLGRE